jgi:hypothetical protein
MSLLIELTGETETRVRRAAEQSGCLPEALAREMVETVAAREAIERPDGAAAAAYIRSLLNASDNDLDEQQETLEALVRGLNANRAANGERLLFP